MAKDVHVERRVEIPEGVDVAVNGFEVTVRGPKGTLTKKLPRAKGVYIKRGEGQVVVESFFADARRRAMVGTLAAHVENMIVGVTRGYTYKLKIIYSHFPISVKVEGDRVVISNFLGEKATRTARILPGVKVTVKGSDIIVEGIDVEAVSQTAANIELAAKVADFDRRKFMDGIYIYEKGVAEA